MSEKSEEPSEDEESELAKLFKAFDEASDEGDVERSQQLSLQVWAAMAREMEAQPEPLCLAEWRKADECESASDWDGAEAAFKRAIAAEEAEGKLSWQGQRYLALFYSSLERDEEAMRSILKAAELARQAQVSLWITGVQQQEAALHLKRGDVETARSRLDEALEAASDEKHLKSVVVGLRLMKVECNLASGELDTAAKELDDLWPQVEPWRDAPMSAGFQNALAEWWRARALYWEAREQEEAAVEAWRQAVHYRRIIAQAPQLEGPYKFKRLALALRALGRALQRTGSPLAAHAFTESRSLLRSIGLPETAGE